MDFVLELLQINWWTLFTNLLVILVSVQFIVKLVVWFVEWIGIETKHSKKKKNIERRLTDAEQEIEKLKQIEATNSAYVQEKGKEIEDHHDKDYDKIMIAIDSVNKNINEMRQEKIEEQLAEKRWKIINFATDLSTGKQFFHESYKYIIGIHEDYQALLEKNNLTNGLVDANMEYIMEEYSKALKEGFFTKGV